MKTGLVLEGGGMRGVYTAGALECFLENDIHFPYITAVSAGACNAVSYISGQRGRNRKVTIDYVKHPRYLSLRNWFLEGSLFGLKLLFDELPNKLVPFDYDAFYENPAEFWVGMTDAVTGEAVFQEKSATLADRGIMPYIKASSSLPFFSPPVKTDGRTLFDGGVAASIPIHKSISDGNKKHVVVLTQPAGYRKKESNNPWLTRAVYRKYSGLVEAIGSRASQYNQTLELLDELRGNGEAIIIQPSRTTGVGRMTKDQVKLTEMYELGYEDAQAQLSAIRALLGR